MTGGSRRKFDGPPDAIKQINKDAKLLEATMNRAKPSPIARSLRAQIIGMMKHWWRHTRICGAVEIYPGMENMAKWGGVSVRQARDNFGALKNWGVVEPLFYEQGGRRTTRFRVNGECLFRALVTLRCNPSPELREKLQNNPEVCRRIALSEQQVNPLSLPGFMGHELELDHDAQSGESIAAECNRNPEVQSLQNPEENPEATSAGIQSLCATSVSEPTGASVSSESRWVQAHESQDVKVEADTVTHRFHGYKSSCG